MRRYFITGTDTGVGKTFVGCTLVRRYRALHPEARVFAYKPVETGVVGGPGALGEDQEALVAAAGGWQQGDARGTYQFKLPAAPNVASRAERAEIDLARVERVLAGGSEGAAMVIVEGAGGLRVPMTDTVDMAAVAKRFDLPVIIVARAGLGTINHTLLTVEAAVRDGLRVAAVVLSKKPDEDDAFADSNAEEIRARIPRDVPVIVMRRPEDLDALV